jgi:hypothetical protein
MMARLLKDSIVATSLVIAAAIAAFYVIPGVPGETLLRIGDVYSRLPLWPWAIAASLVGLRAETPVWIRRMLQFQAASFSVLLAIEAHRAVSPEAVSVGWDVTEEWLYVSYYAMSLLSAAAALGTGANGPRRRRLVTVTALSLTVASATGLSISAIYFRHAYETVVPSYAVYLTLNAIVVVLFAMASRTVPRDWRAPVLGLALAAVFSFATDLLDFLYYQDARWALTPGTAWDLLWTLPVLLSIVAIRLGRLREPVSE